MKKRKGILGLLTLVGMAVISLAGCTQLASNPTVDNWDKYQQQKSITVGFDNTFVPMGFEDAFPYSLSGGQKQRVALARAMMIDPEIIGYDEPTSALDPALRLEVEKLILQNKELGMTQIVVTHDLTFAENIADELLTFEPK